MNRPIACLIVLLLLVPALWAQTPADLERSFANPPPSARPWTWWHWVDGNVTREGITLDLEAMQRVGIGGVQLFNVGCGIPAGPIRFLSDDWRALVQHAIREADRLDMEVCLHNTAGWSSSGGPWIKPEHAMQMVVTSEVRLGGAGYQPARGPDSIRPLQFNLFRYAAPGRETLYFTGRYSSKQNPFQSGTLELR